MREVNDNGVACNGSARRLRLRSHERSFYV